MSGTEQPAGRSPLARRQAGILLHPTSLPGPWKNGDLGSEAYHFVDFLVSAGQSVWQVLPLGPTNGGSPYQSFSAHAGNPQLISIELLKQWGWLTGPYDPEVDSKDGLLERAYHSFLKQALSEDRDRFETFALENAHWLDDFALYSTLKPLYDQRCWSAWPTAVRDRDPEALKQIRVEHAETLEIVRFEQFVFFRQWALLKQYANERGITLFGDMPIFVAYDSAEVWAERQYFALDEKGLPTVVAGVPPDYFSETGQLWGNPHYRWEAMREDGFAWWKSRVEAQLRLFDLVRIDHFRGFESYWEVPADEKTAINGRWVQAPGEALFDALRAEFDPLPVVAEDLGIITPEVVALRDGFALPGMLVLQFAFDGGSDNLYLPHNHQKNAVVYTGTHDNDTTLGWFERLTRHQRTAIDEYLGHPGEQMPWPLIRAAYRSVADLAVIPMQDALELGSDQRMNTPGTVEGNWGWRFHWGMVESDVASRLRRLAVCYGRLPPEDEL